MSSKVIGLALLGVICNASLIAADCTADLAAATADADNVKASLGKFKKAVIAIPIVLGFVLLLVGIILGVLIKKLLGLKKKLPSPLKDMTIIGFFRNLDKGLDVNVETGAKVNLNVDVGVKTGSEINLSERDNKEDEKKKKQDKGKKSKLEEEVKDLITREEIGRDNNDLLSRGIFHIAFRGRYKNMQVVVKLFSYPIEKDDSILLDVVEEHRRRHKVRDEVKSKFLVETVGTIGDHPYYGFVTRYYEQGSVYRSLIEKKEKYSDKEIARLAYEVAEAVRALHERNHLHKGIAARNVLLDAERSARLDLFFEPSNSLSVYGKQHGYVGPVAWLAPETIETKKHTKASDAFSFGVYLWELVARDDPYADRNVITVACPLIHKGLRLQIPENSPAPFAKLMKSCFDEKPENRPTFDDMAKELKAYHDSL